MSEPIIEQIAQNVETTINGITTGNGYNYTLNAVRPKRIPFDDAEWDSLDVLINQADKEFDNTLQTNAVDKTETFSLSAIIIQSEDATTELDLVINQVAADIEKALKVDITRGGLARDTLVTSASRFTINEAFTGIVIDVDIKFRTVFNDPYTQT